VDSADPTATGVDGGAGRQRQKNIENARLKVVGDMVAGDKFMISLGDGEPAPLQALATWMSEPVRHAFIEPPGWADVRAAAGDRRVVVLRAAPGHGKVAAAIRLLQSPSDRRIFNLDRNIDLGHMKHWLETDAKGDDPLPKGSGFLLCEPLGWEQLQAWVLQQLETTLERLDARLVLTLAANTPLPDTELLPYIVALESPPEQAEILAAHLSWWLRESRTAADQILAEAGLAVFVKDVFATATSMKTAADLAVMISQELDGATVNLAKLKRRWNERATEDFEIWFGGLPDVPTRCLAIALAVLNGLPYENVVYAAQRLAARLDGPRKTNEGGGPPWRNPFASTRREMERLLRAQIRPAAVRGPFGVAPAEVMEYVAEGYAGAVLERVWREYQVQSELLSWLRDLAENRSEEVRIWTATAIGLLSTQAFDFVYGLVLRPMSIEDKFWLRDVVANALSVPAADARLRPMVEAVVGQLYGNTVVPLGQATAARVWGVGLGTADPERALTALERLTTIDDRRIAQGIGDSLADLLLADETGNAVPVLSRVSSWLYDKKRKLTGEFVFLLLARNLTAEPVAGGRGERGAVSSAAPGAWPMLLMLADQRRELRDGLIGMWWVVLCSGALSVTTEQVLARWADMAEADAGVRTAFARMLAAVPARGDRAEPLVRYHIKKWRSVDNLQPKPKTAYEVEAALNARNGTP
jgi:hypothetical protein